MTTKKTPLYALQNELGARFVAFAGWQMPVQFNGVLTEHHSVRQNAGIFDVSHMGEVFIEGPEAQQALDYITTNHVMRLQDFQAQYTVMCREDGGIIDDLIIYRENAERFMLCINASRRDNDVAHLQQYAKDFDCSVKDVSDDFAQLALQGPMAAKILEILDCPVMNTLQPFQWCHHNMSGLTHILFARTGYTGEDGVEMYCAPSQAPALWQALLQAGQDVGIQPCGLAARDTLRLEMKYALYGQDIDLEHNPLEAGLGWVVKTDKGAFVGRDALCRIRAAGLKRKLVAFIMQDRGIARHGYDIAYNQQTIGTVTSGSHSPSLGQAIGLGYVPIEHSKVGTTLQIIIRSKPVDAVIVAPPFYKRDKT